MELMHVLCLGYLIQNGEKLITYRNADKERQGACNDKSFSNSRFFVSTNGSASTFYHTITTALHICPPLHAWF